MNKRFFFLAAITLLAAACQKEQPAQETSSTGLKVIASVENTDGNTKTSLDGLNVKWSVGDQIELTNGSQTAIYQATEAAATTTFTKVSGDDLSDGDVYAYYPAGNVTGFSSGVFTATIPAVQAYKADGFADGSNPMTAKGTISGSAVTLAFKNVMSFVKVQINDTAAGKTLAGLSLTSPSANLSGTASVTVGENGVPATVISSGSKTVELDGISAGLSTAAVSAYIAVPVGELGKLTITAKTEETSGNYFQTKEAANALTTVRSSVNAYNAIGISTFTGKTLCPSVPANSYMVDATKQTSIVIPLSQAEAGWDAIKALEPSDTFDKTKITTGTRTIEVRWFDVEVGAKTITCSAVDEKNLTLNFANCVNGTNAVVDLKNGEDVVWSWHIWFTDYKPAANQASTLNGQVHTYSGAAFQAGGLYEGKVMMDRNLGATITGVSGAIAQPTDKESAQKYWGLYYQFGRKEPFATTGTLSPAPVNVTENADKKTYAYAAQHPAEFYYTATKSDAWSSTDANTEPMTDPWNSTGTKSAFDPCPAGWRIPNNGTTPKNNVWTGITTDSWKAETESSNKTGGYLWNGAWLPATGVRLAHSGKTSNTGSRVYYWSASPRSAGAGCYAHFYSGGAYAADNDPGSRAYGFSVRCVKE